MQQRDSVAIDGYLCEAVMYCAVGGFVESFCEELVVAVVVAENADEGAVEFFESGDCEG